MSESRFKSDVSVPEKMRAKYDPIVSLIDAFCRDRLNEEYAQTAREMAGLLARKRPSPLASGTAAVWAAGILRVIGSINFLNDSTQKLHMNLTEIDKAMGISQATGSAKAKTIRDMLKINHFDPKWTLPSKLADNPMVWMIQVNGFIMDARRAPREIREEAERKGIIPTLPHPSDDSAD